MRATPAQAFGVPLNDVEESIAGAELQSEAAGQIASAAAKLDIPTIIQVMNAHLDVSRVQVTSTFSLTHSGVHDSLRLV